jgi:hypothetical protein
VLVVADCPGWDLEMVEQLAGVAGVLGGDQGDFTQYAQRPQRNIFKVAYRRANHV